MKFYRTVLVALSMLVCPIASGQNRPVVYTVNYPLEYFAQRIGGDAVEVVCPAPSGCDPAYWIPTTDLVLGYQSADVILLNGANYAGWLDRVSLPPSRLVNTSATRAAFYAAMGAGQAHTHGPGGKHEEHTGWAFTTWLDFDWARSQADAIIEALIVIAPDSENDFRSNFANLDRELAALDSLAAEIGRQAAGRPLLGSHPVYQYLARRYELNIKSVHWEPGEDPGPAGWRDLQHVRGDHSATIMLWEADPLPDTRTKLTEQGVVSVVLDPCAAPPSEGEFLSTMKGNLSRLKAALDQAP